MPRATKPKQTSSGQKALPQQMFSNRPYAMPNDLKAAFARSASQPELIAVSSNLPPNAAQIWESEIK